MNNSKAIFQIGRVAIGPETPPYCIAEVGINHNGDLQIAKKMIDLAKEVGADAVKFQTFKAEEFCGNAEQVITYISQGQSVSESMLAMFKRFEFPDNYWQEIKNYCNAVNIEFFSTPQNKSDLDLLMKLDVPAIKIGSDDLTNLPLLRTYVETKLPLILSCGMSDIADVHQALEAAGWFDGYPVSLLLCTSQYPTPPQDVNIIKIKTLQNAFPGLIVGFSDHTIGSQAAALAVACGAKIFEKHFTLSHDMPGPDHWFSEDPKGLAEWIQSIKTANVLMGSPFVRPTESERGMRLIARRSVVAVTDIKKGQILDKTNIGLRRPGDGLPPDMLNQVLGMRSTRNISKGDRLKIGDMQT